MSFPWYGRSRISGLDQARRAGRSRRRRTTLLLERCEDRVLLASLVSVNAAGTASGNSDSAAATVSADGRFVVFTSEANDLAPGDTNLLTDVFVRDLALGTTTLVSVDAIGTASGNGASTTPSISADGRFVAFTSSADDLVATNNAVGPDVFVRDLATGTTTLVSAVGLTGANGPSANPIISADGSTVAFTSQAENLVPGDNNNFTDVFAFDLATGTTTLVSVNNVASAANGPSASVAPRISANGQVIAFTSSASDLVAIDTNLQTDVFVRDLAAGTTTLASVNDAGTDSGTGASAAAALSADGTRVAFTSEAFDLAPVDTNLLTDVFLRDLAAGTTTLVSVNATGTNSGTGISANPILSADGTVVAFTSTASDLGPVDTNLLTDVYARVLAAGATILVSANTTNTDSGNNASAAETPAISADGRYVGFTSAASNLVTNDTNLLTDVFLRDLVAGTTTLASVNAAGTDSGNNASAAPSLSADGRIVAFTSEASDLVTNDTNLLTDVFVANLAGQFTVSPPGNVDEGAGTATITVTRTGGSIGTVTVDFVIIEGTATAGADYIAPGGTTLTFLPGQTSQTITIPIVADTLDEPNETLGVALGNPTGGTELGAPSSGVLTIVDNDPTPTISFTGGNGGGAGDASAPEGTSAVFTVTLSAPSGRTITVEYSTSGGTATSGPDFTGTSGTLTFLPGQTTGTIVVPALVDGLDEPTEAFTLALGNVTNATIADVQAVGTILDIDATPPTSGPTPTISFTGGAGGAAGDASAPEGTTAVFTVTLSGPSDRIITVDFVTSGGTATSGADYAGVSGTLTFLPGQTSQTIGVPTRADGLVEPAETFVLSLGNATNATIADVQAVGTILDATQAPGGGGTQTPGGVTGALDPGSDSGVSNADGITNDNTPTFIGTAPPGSTVQITAVPASGGSPVVIGQGVADGNGNYRITAGPLPDGSYTIRVTATNAAGLPIASSQILPGGGTGPLVIDTAGPRVVGSVLDPSTGRILVTYQDSGGGLDQRSLVNRSFYRTSRPFAPRPRDRSVSVSGVSTTASTSQTGPQAVAVSLDGGRRVVHARFVFEILAGGVADAAGNALDGEFVGTFPSGNNRPGGDFAAQLDFDGRRVFPARGVSGGFVQRRSAQGRRRFGAASVRPLSTSAVREIALAQPGVSR